MGGNTCYNRRFVTFGPGIGIGESGIGNRGDGIDRVARRRMSALLPRPVQCRQCERKSLALTRRLGERVVMPRFGRRPLFIAVPLTALILATLAVILLTRGHDLKARLALVSPGMTREQVEGVLGPPLLVMRKGPTGTGDALVWVDQLWQVDVVIGPDGRVIRCGCTPSDSLFRRTVGRVISLPK